MNANFYSKGLFNWDDIDKEWTQKGLTSGGKGKRSCKSYQSTFRNESKAWHTELMQNKWFTLKWINEEVGLGGVHKCDVKYKDLIIKEIKGEDGVKRADPKYGAFIRDMQATAWSKDVPPEFNSIVDINCDIKFGKGKAKNEIGTGILFGAMAYLNHQCGHPLRLGEVKPKAKDAAAQSKNRLYIQSIKFVNPKGSKYADDDIVFRAGDDMLLEYQPLNDGEDLGFECQCGMPKCKSKKPLAEVMKLNQLVDTSSSR